MKLHARHRLWTTRWVNPHTQTEKQMSRYRDNKMHMQRERERERESSVGGGLWVHGGWGRRQGGWI